MGRPAKYTSPEDLQAGIKDYFSGLVFNDGESVKPPTVAGLAKALGFESRFSLNDYEKRNEEFSHLIKRARLEIEQYWEERLSAGQCTGAIFWLKNHASYTDKTTQEITGAIETSVSHNLEALTTDELKTLAAIIAKT